MKRLPVQMTLAFTLVAVVAVGTIAFLVMRTTDTQFRRYITHADMQASGSGLQQLIAYYQEQGSWDGVGTLLARAVILRSPSEAAVPAAAGPPAPGPERLDVVLADAKGRVVYDSAGQATDRRLTSRERSRALPIRDPSSGDLIGYILLSLPGAWDRLGALEVQFLARIQRILVIGATLAVAAGLALGAILSRGLTAPLQRLARAARAVAGGDLGQRLELEGSAEMVEVAQAFNDMTAALGESERHRKNMVADVAHELRAPLSVVQGNLRAILDDVYPLDKAEISRLYDESRLLARLVDDLRELALADAGQLGLHLRAVDLVGVIQKTLESLTPAAEAQGVNLAVRLPDDLPPVQADPDRVAQILRNLLLNALRHTPAGGSIAVSATRRREMAEVAVADTGEGIAPEDLPYIFERFWRADPARARTGCTGLGLSVAQSLVEAHGGRIWAQSNLGHGAIFRFTLPLSSDPDRPGV
jgi:two-component system OmpR family sensor kinase/two-component system sensor histidine kinase BaeS